VRLGDRCQTIPRNEHLNLYDTTTMFLAGAGTSSNEKTNARNRDPFQSLHSAKRSRHYSYLMRRVHARARAVPVVPVVWVMGLHKLTAGDGYTYLTRQVAAHDSTEKGAVSLGDYYSEKGGSPGEWLGAGLESLGLTAGQPVTEAQMKSLFGHGRHPDADRLAADVAAIGGSTEAALAAGALGRPFNVYAASSSFQIQVAREFTTHNTDRKLPWNAPIPVDERLRSAPRSARGCSPSSTDGRPRTRANSPGSSPAIRGRAPPRSPASTSPSRR
jgi:hypothetical protein